MTQDSPKKKEETDTLSFIFKVNVVDGAGVTEVDNPLTGDGNDDYLVDTGATTHIVCDEKCFTKTKLSMQRVIG